MEDWKKEHLCSNEIKADSLNKSNHKAPCPSYLLKFSEKNNIFTALVKWQSS